MIETYSQNVTVPINTAIPFNSTSILKGCTATKSAPDTIQLNKCGVYMVSFDATAAASGTTIGNITVQLAKDGVLQPQALSTTASTATTDVESISFVTLVQVSENNSCRCCDSPTLITFRNTGVEATFTQANVVVTKIC